MRKSTVWRALWSEGVVGPYFFENDNGTTVSVNSERYGHIIFCLLLNSTTWRICGFNKSVPHARQQVGFQSNSNCLDQANAVYIIIEQSLEWRSTASTATGCYIESIV